MFPLHVLDDVAQVVSVAVQTSLGPGQGQAAGGVRSEVAQVPPFDKFAEGRYSGVLLQSAEGCYPQSAIVLEPDKFRFFAFRFYDFSVGQSFQILEKHTLYINSPISVLIYPLPLRFPLPRCSHAIAQYQKGGSTTPHAPLEKAFV